MWRSMVLLMVTLLPSTLSMAAAPALPANLNPGTSANENEEFLPYGVPIPPGQEVTSDPEPYNPAKHGPPNPNPIPQANLVGKPGAILARRGSAPHELRAVPEPGTGDRGFLINRNQGVGVYAGNDAQTDLVIPDNAIGTTIYAPTHLPASKACVETVTVHFRYQGMAGTKHDHGFWDWCGVDGSTGWQVYENMNADWKSKYVRVADGEERYFTQVWKSGSCWKGLLYNYSAGRWDERTSICGSHADREWGWTMWESWEMMDKLKVCPNFPGIRASGIRIYKDSQWVLLAPDHTQGLGPSGKCWTEGIYTFHVHQANHDWHAHTP
jgi:hypothetical protein